MPSKQNESVEERPIKIAIPGRGKTGTATAIKLKPEK